MNKSEEQFKKVYKELKIPKGCPGISWRHDSSDGDFDIELLPILKKLNSLVYCHTTGSCVGHSASEIKKGESLFDSPYTLSITLHVKVDHLNDFKLILFAMADVSVNKFWCEFGYHDDYNCRTEKGYIPLMIKVFCETKKFRDKLLDKYGKILDEAPNLLPPLSWG